MNGIQRYFKTAPDYRAVEHAEHHTDQVIDSLEAILKRNPKSERARELLNGLKQARSSLPALLTELGDL